MARKWSFMEDYMTVFSSNLSSLGSLPALHIWRHLVTKLGTTKNLPKLQRFISVPFLSGLYFMPNWPNECTQTFIRYARISSFSAGHVLSWDSVHIGSRLRANSQNSEFCVTYVLPIFSTDKTNIVRKYTNFITSSEIFQALFVSDRLYVKCQNTSCFSWCKSNL